MKQTNIIVFVALSLVGLAGQACAELNSLRMESVPTTAQAPKETTTAAQSKSERVIPPSCRTR